MAARPAGSHEARPASERRRAVPRAFLRLAAVGATIASITGCSLLVGAARMYYDSTPEGSEMREWGLRRTLARGAFDTALRHVSSRDEAAPRDKLLRSLYDGLVAFYAGEYERSGHSFRTADELADDRYTKSISRGALSMVSNDLVLPYMPGQTERLLLHYYAALSYLRRNDVPGAAVEVRRMSHLLEEFDERREPADRSTRAFLRYFAGAVFEAVGERNDADVAYRNARELAAPGMLPAETIVPNLSGEVIVLLERGFVAQRVEESIYIDLDGSDRDSVDSDGHRADSAASDASGIGELLRQLESDSDGGVYRTGGRRLHRHHHTDHDSDDFALKVAWPVYLRPIRHVAPAQVIRGTTVAAPFTLSGDISDAIIADYRRQRLLMLTRTIARATVKYAATEAAEKKKGEAGKAIASIAGSVLEHADTRSWHLLPADIGLARIVLPPGRQHLSIRVGAEAGDARVIDLGDVEITPGGIVFLSTRLWPDLPRFASTHER